MRPRRRWPTRTGAGVFDSGPRRRGIAAVPSSTAPSHSVSADAWAHCTWSRRGRDSQLRQTPSWVVLDDPVGLSTLLPAPRVSVLGGKAWISPFPLSLAL